MRYIALHIASVTMLARCWLDINAYWKYLAADVQISFSMNNSESNMAICAALPIKVLVDDGKQ